MNYDWGKFSPYINQSQHAHSISKVKVHAPPVIVNWEYILKFGGTLKIKYFLFCWKKKNEMQSFNFIHMPIA